MAEPVSLSIQDLPTTVLSLCLEKLDDPRHLATAGSVCRLWCEIASSSPSWKAFCGRWQHWNDAKYAEMRAAGQFNKVYPLRLKADQLARQSLDELVHPLKRHGAIQYLIQLGNDGKDAILNDAAAGGSTNIGRRYWGLYAQSIVTTAWCTGKLRRLLERGPAADVLGGALLLAESLDPEADLAAVVQRIDALAAELRSRMAAAGCQNDLQGLKLLCGLLFGERPGGFAAQDALPPPGRGLQLSGNRDAYYDANNSLLHRVFETGQGIPISLSVIAVAVGRRAGLALEPIGAAGHFMAALLAPEDGGGGGDGGGEDFFLDAFNGRVMSRRETEDLLQGQGVPLQMQALHAVGPRDVMQRMATNLLKVYLGTAPRLPEARCVLELMCTINPTSQDCKFGLAQVCLALGDYQSSLNAVLAIMQPGTGAGRVETVITMQLPALVQRTQREQEALAAEARAPHARAPALLHRLGHLIRHRKYNYRGVIYGWDEHCNATDHWMQTMNIDGLPGGRHQPFYHVLVDSRHRPGQTTYVAQENIEVMERTEGEDDDSFLVLQSEIGEYFDGIAPGASRYTPNVYRRFLFPED